MGRKERVIKKHGHGYRVIGTHGHAFLREDLALKGCELSIFFYVSKLPIILSSVCFCTVK